MMKRLLNLPIFDPNRLNLLFLIPVAAVILADGEEAMSREEITSTFPGNTIISQLPEGTAYAYVLPGGRTNGQHPAFGKLSGQWQIDDKGVVCVTWPVPNGEIKNCSQTVDLGEGQYNWANQVIRLLPGDPKGLAG